MTSAAISAQGLKKRYVLGPRQRYGTLSGALMQAFRRRAPSTQPHDNVLWALGGVSFEIGHAEKVAIIGRNGSGKSTLLKVLPRITEPTSGRATVAGTVGALLVVGTGFHPELSGRENIFVNGAILGMKRADIAARFDEIVEFADVARFIDTPVKHYSSGMQMRLAFAVAAHLQPNILLVDEVLAVGDVAFQRKCLGKMDDVSKEGRTILFVSHQMNQLRRLCDRAIWLDGGQVVEDGPAADVINRYEARLSAGGLGAPSGRASAAEFLGWRLAGADAPHVLRTDDRCTVSFDLNLTRSLRHGHHGIGLYDNDGVLVWGTGTDNLDLDAGRHVVSYSFASLPLRPGVYRWHVTIIEGDEVLESLSCVPDLLIATMPTGHRRDECAGFLNLNYTIGFAPAAAQPSLEAERA